MKYDEYEKIGTIWPSFYFFLAITTIIFLILGYIIWKKTKPQTTGRHLLLSGIIIFLMTTYWTLGYVVGIFSTPQEYYVRIFPEKKVPTKIRSAVDQFVIRQVGKNEFEKNYMIDYQRTENCYSSRIGCVLTYEFLPGRRYGGIFSNLFYGYSTQTIEIVNDYYLSTEMLSCELDKNKCSFVLSLDEVNTIALRENLQDRRFVMHEGKIVIELKTCKRSGQRAPRRVLIDPSNGQTLLDQSIQECIDVGSGSSFISMSHT